MNNTKWNEIRLAMNDIPYTVKQRTKDLENGYISQWNADWFYHFMIGGYKTIEWLEIQFTSKTKDIIVNKLKEINVPAELLENSVKIYGYKDGFIDYL